MANSVDADQTAPSGSGSALFAQTYMSQNLAFYKCSNVSFQHVTSVATTHVLRQRYITVTEIDQRNQSIQIDIL